MRLCTAAFLSLKGKGLEYKDLLCLDSSADNQDPGCFGNAEVYKQRLNTKNQKGVKLRTMRIETKGLRKR